jgi:hypothetical protein
MLRKLLIYLSSGTDIILIFETPGIQDNCLKMRRNYLES